MGNEYLDEALEAEMLPADSATGWGVLVPPPPPTGGPQLLKLDEDDWLIRRRWRWEPPEPAYPYRPCAPDARGERGLGVDLTGDGCPPDPEKSTDKCPCDRDRPCERTTACGGWRRVVLPPLVL